MLVLPLEIYIITLSCSELWSYARRAKYWATSVVSCCSTMETERLKGPIRRPLLWSVTWEVLWLPAVEKRLREWDTRNMEVVCVKERHLVTFHHLFTFPSMDCNGFHALKKKVLMNGVHICLLFSKYQHLRGEKNGNLRRDTFGLKSYAKVTSFWMTRVVLLLGKR